MKIESNKIAAASFVMAGLAWSISPASAQVNPPRGITADGPMSIMVPFVAAATKDRPAKQPYALIVEAPLARDTLKKLLPPPSGELAPSQNH